MNLAGFTPGVRMNFPAPPSHNSPQPSLSVGGVSGIPPESNRRAFSDPFKEAIWDEVEREQNGLAVHDPRPRRPAKYFDRPKSAGRERPRKGSRKKRDSHRNQALGSSSNSVGRNRKKRSRSRARSQSRGRSKSRGRSRSRSRNGSRSRSRSCSRSRNRYRSRFNLLFLLYLCFRYVCICYRFYLGKPSLFDRGGGTARLGSWDLLGSSLLLFAAVAPAVRRACRRWSGHWRSR
mmetsp:Transcript_21456/g.42603  ORF Transcript_21456/g.42603 Transcript_21456/m.42603 type:complete len:234 (-) Transcript_21456:81-782(-)